MQKTTLDNFLKDINNIREYTKHIELVNSIVVNNKHFTSASLISFNKHLNTFNTEKKIFEYKATIISLYGILENFISILIREHIHSISILIKDYHKLSDEFKKSHFNLSIKLISIINENRYVKFEHLVKEDILNKLNSCITEPINFELNGDAFIPSSGNLKHSKIVDAFRFLNIHLDNTLKNDYIFSKYLKSLFGENMSNKENEILFNKINDLVSRRNEIAHGNIIDDILDFTMFEEYIEFVEEYGKAIYSSLIEKEIEYEAKNYYKIIPKVNKVFQKSILDCDINDSTIKKGDLIIIEDTNNKFFKTEILDIHLNRVSCNKLVLLNTVNVGIMLASEIKENQKFYIKIIKNHNPKKIYYPTVT